MASRKRLKKAVRNISDQLLCDCIALNMIEDIDRAKLNELTAEVLALQNDIVARISHTEPGAVKLFYKKLSKDFLTRVEELSIALQNV